MPSTRRALLALALLGALLLAAGCGSSAAATATATATATHQPVGPTASAGQNSGPAALGGTGQAFINTYGPLTSQSDASMGDLHFRQYAGVAQDFLIVSLGVRLGITPGDQNAANILVSAPPSTTWTMSQADATCSVFFPSDAKRIKSVPVADSSGVIAEDALYHSDALARVFPTSAFVDASQKPTTPGSFDVMYLYAPPNSIGKIDSCQIALGTQQTTP
jgi:hypothetical protein